QSMLPSPAGATTASLSGVDCTNPTHCVAVGSYTAGQVHALVERLSGTTWTPTTAIDPPAASSAGLSAVSCRWAGDCVAVGTADGAPLVEKSAHGHWTPTSLALPAGATAAGLSGVSCLASSPCQAVGSVTESSQSEALIESRPGTGGSWTPTVDTVTPEATLDAVSCDHSGNCEAVGGSAGGPLAESGHGSTWTPTTAVPGSAVLSSVWCDPSGTGDCTAWGVAPATTAGFAVIDSLSAGTWSRVTLSPLTLSAELEGSCSSPSNCVAFNEGDNDVTVLLGSPTGWQSEALSGPPDATLTDVSCSTTFCAAVGVDDDRSASPVSFIESLVDGSWQTIPGPEVQFNQAVSCSGSFCAVVSGDTATTSTDGVHWTSATLPSPSGFTGILGIDGISCVAAGSCVAVGLPSGEGEGLVAEVLQSGSWTAAKIANPAGSSGGNLAAISCLTVTSCVAVGSADLSSGIESLVEVLSGTTWTGTVLPAAPSFTYGDLDAVSCPSASSCVAVGSAFPSSGGVGEPLVETLASGSWTPTTQIPLAGTPYGTNDSVACPSAGTCYATQLDEGSTGTIWQFMALAAGSWTESAIPTPAGDDTDSPVAVSCSPASWCTVAGSVEGPVSADFPEVARTPLIATLGAPAPAITSAAAATAKAGTAFSFTVTTTGAPTAALSESGDLPAGLHFTDNHDGTATIAGTTTVRKGTHLITISADNGLAPAVTQAFTITCTH
ncbi:MAG TPA: hypothetical protein VN799_06185, partial [Acidimicrobiales bacterium]|nr:hypothetical protein [Acidimicrobiales bacterium]